MKEKIVEWLWANRVTIGYTIGFANILSGLANILMGNVSGGLLYLGIGLFLVWDVKTYK